MIEKIAICWPHLDRRTEKFTPLIAANDSLFGLPATGAVLAIIDFMYRDTAGHEELTESIIRCGMRVHETWGPGLLESVYKACLIIELEEAGRRVESNRRLHLVYRGRDLNTDFCPDIVVDGVVVVEVKALERLAPVHKAQLITYLKLTGLPVGLLMNFNVPLLKEGVQRLVRPDLLIKT